MTRAQVRLNVRQAFYQVLGAEAVLRAAQAAQANRQLISRQLSTLAENGLRSTLDVNFANVLASEAELAVVRAESVVARQRSHLSTAMGLDHPVNAPLADVAAPPSPLPPNPEELLHEALTQRADLGAFQARRQAAATFALSESVLAIRASTSWARPGRSPTTITPSTITTPPPAST